MYKLIRLFNVEEEKNKVKSADYEVILEFEEFDYSDKTKEMLLSVCKEKRLQIIHKRI